VLCDGGSETTVGWLFNLLTLLAEFAFCFVLLLASVYGKMVFSMISFVLCSCLFWPLVAPAPTASRPTVTIASGVVVGTSVAEPSSGVIVNQYLGIPFAASPPVRFAPPEAALPWTTPLNASAFKDACVQQFNCKNLDSYFT
jgi:hypothetical protein